MHVLIVDDSPINLALMQALVQRIPDCSCTSQADPLAALEWCSDHIPDLILLDYMMPGMNGLEFLGHCRTRGALADVPVLMVTAIAEKEIRYAALEQGATDFLTKPIDKLEFMSRVRNMLAVRRSHLITLQRADDLARAVADATAEIRRRELDTVMRLARAAEYRDPETGAHILRMAEYSVLIARELGWNHSDLALLQTAAPMHDVGKVGTPDSILLKPGRLTPEEFEVMKEHARIGYEILRDSSSPMLQMAAEIALSHHEKFDGSGYPDAHAGDDIPLCGRIVAVADVFDALTSVRPYKPAWELERARDYMREGEGKHFDPRCVEAFLDRWEQVLEIRERHKDPDPPPATT